MKEERNTELERIVKDLEAEFSNYQDYSAALMDMVKQMAFKLNAQELQIAKYRAKLKLQRKTK
jgi:hypothetical protein